MNEDLHAPFARATRAAFATPLRHAFWISPVNPEEWAHAWQEVRPLCFPRDRTELESVHTDLEKERFAALGRSLGHDPLCHHLVIRREGSDLVGVVRGSQRLRADWHMSITAINPAFQGLGIYTELLQRLLPIFKQAGFRRVVSRHHADNSSVLVPKLKAGFIITGVEISPKRGLMIELSYPLGDDLRAAYAQRIDPDRC